MYSVAVAVGVAPSHVGRHDVSFARHVIVTHTAIDTQFGSFGQLAEVAQQLAATQDTHDGAAEAKISFAPVQLPPSPISTPLSVAVLASLGGAPPPPAATGPPHMTSWVGTQGPI
jgi:hypothetical protein